MRILLQMRVKIPSSSKMECSHGNFGVKSKEGRVGRERAWIPIPVLPPISCVALDKLVSLRISSLTYKERGIGLITSRFYYSVMQRACSGHPRPHRGQVSKWLPEKREGFELPGRAERIVYSCCSPWPSDICLVSPWKSFPLFLSCCKSETCSKEEKSKKEEIAPVIYLIP